MSANLRTFANTSAAFGACYCLALFACENKEPQDSQDSGAVPTAEQEQASRPLKRTITGAPLDQMIAKADASADAAWTTEAFAENAQARLDLLLEWISAPADLPPAGLISPAAFKASELRPSLRTVSNKPPLLVQRPEIIPKEQSHRGAKGFQETLAKLVAAFAGEAGDFHGKFKIVGIEALEGNGYSTQVYYEGHRGRVQQNSEWRCTWSAVETDTPLLDSIELLWHEEIRASGDHPLFADCTEALLGENESYRKQLVYPASHWHGNLDVAFGINQGNQGIAIGDVDGDGLEDIYACQPDGMPNRLFVQQPDGTLIDRSREAGLDYLDISRSALFVDLDNDGDQDFLLAHRFSVTIHENDGSGKFTAKITLPTESRISGLSAADYDNDGDLDFYAAGYSPMKQTSPEDIFANPVPYEDANNGAFSYLFRNTGEFRFENVTSETGLDQNNTRFSFVGVWEDFDNDGDQDLYVANDFGRNNLYRNELVPSGQSVFKDVAGELEVEDIGAGMSADWGDPNNDGMMDLYVGNMWSSAGKRITFQQQFQAKIDEETRQMLQRHARGNSLFTGRADGGFEDLSLTAGVNMGRWAWGSLFFDLNNDGWEDLYTTNGFMTAPDSGDL